MQEHMDRYYEGSLSDLGVRLALVTDQVLVKSYSALVRLENEDSGVRFEA